MEADAGSPGPSIVQPEICTLKVHVTGNVNRMEGSSFMAGADTLGLAFILDRLISCTLRVPVSS